MSTVNPNPDQTHLDQDITEIAAGESTIVNNFVTVINDLKSQPGAAALDFTAADALVTQVTGDATTTTSELPTPPVPPANVTQPAGGPVNPANP